MKSRHEVYLNGNALSEVHSDLYVADIQYPAPQIADTSSTLAKRAGALLTRRYQAKTAVNVLFNLYIYSTRERYEALKAVQSWAKGGGILETSDREWQRLRVILDTPPTITSAANYNETLTAVFAANTLPYWEETNAAVLNVTDNNAHDMYVPGNVDECGALVDVQATLTGSATSLKVQAGTNEITLSGLNFASGDVVRLYHDDDLFLHITKNNTSILDKRTGADDLMVENGAKSTFKITGPASASFTVRGLWR